MEIAQLDNHPYYVAVQFHPEYLSRPLKPSPPFLGLILASVKQLDKFLEHGCRLPPSDMGDVSSGKFFYCKISNLFNFDNKWCVTDEETNISFNALHGSHQYFNVNGNGVHSSDESEHERNVK